MGGDATPTHIPPEVLIGVEPMDKPDCTECTLDPFPLDRTRRAIVADPKLRLQFRNLQLGVSKSDDLAALAEMERRACCEEVKYIIALLRQLVLNSHPSFKDCKTYVGCYISCLGYVPVCGRPWNSQDSCLRMLLNTLRPRVHGGGA